MNGQRVQQLQKRMLSRVNLTFNRRLELTIGYVV